MFRSLGTVTKGIKVVNGLPVISVSPGISMVPLPPGILLFLSGVEFPSSTI